MKFPIPAICAALVAASLPAAADLYTYTTGEGTVCFTDNPGDRKARLVARERPAKRAEPVRASRTAAVASPAPPATEKPPLSCNLPVQGRITSQVGLRNDPFDGALRWHNGIDIAVPAGTEIRAVAPGRVTYSGFRSGYGNMVTVDHGDGTITMYAHNSVNLAAEGTLVGDDSVIALAGSTGRSTGPHLHFEAWENGRNVTPRYAGNAVPALPATLASAKPRIRSFEDADGVLVFTNLP